MREEKRKDLTPTVLYEADSFLVVDKPSGWITNEADTTTSQPVLQTWLKRNLRYEISNSDKLRSGVVHRLDKETSGCLIIAKTENAFYKLQAEFKDRVVSKKYIALVHGILKSDSGEVDAAVGRLPWRRDRFGVLAGGRQANTFYKVLEQYKDYSLVKFEPHTGRTHQIRIHAKHLGHAIVSDAFYAGRKTARKDRLWCPRLFLHAGYINFIDPDTEKRVEVNSPLPRELQDVLDSLEKSELTR